MQINISDQNPQENKNSGGGNSSIDQNLIVELIVLLGIAILVIAFVSGWSPSPTPDLGNPPLTTPTPTTSPNNLEPPVLAPTETPPPAVDLTD